MKKITYAILFSLLATACASAQSGHLDANLVHNWNYLDRDIELSAEKFFNKNGFKVSLLYFQNTAEQSLNWEMKPRASNFKEHWGFGLVYLRYLPLKKSNVELYPYVKLTGFKLPYQTHNESFGLISQRPYWKFYSGIGLQVKSKLYHNLYLMASADAGARWENPQASYLDYFDGLAACGAVGLAYRIKG
jgi:hypothetical protein